MINQFVNECWVDCNFSCRSEMMNMQYHFIIQIIMKKVQCCPAKLDL